MPLRTSTCETVSRDLVTSLYDPRFEHDACGTGFVANLNNEPSHHLVQMALEALSRLAHRGAVAADDLSGDGAGLLLQLPGAFFDDEVRRLKGKSSDKALLGVAMLFCIPDRLDDVQRILEEAAKTHRLSVLAWRGVPVNVAALGKHAQRTLPCIVQAVLTTASPSASPEQFEEALFAARTQFERATDPTDVYVCSMSSRTLVYKALCNAHQLANFYQDLTDARLKSAMAIYHQRFATNTTPSWAMAQPFRFLAHNGEINTVNGNRVWLGARLREVPEKLRIVLRTDSSDSALLDNALESVMRCGREVWQALSALLVPAWENQSGLSRDLVGFYRSHAAALEPWDGPAALIFSDGRYVGATLDRNGLRPCRYCITRTGMIVAGSEVGVIDLLPGDITESGRLGPGEMLVVDLQTHRVLRDHAVKQSLAQDASRPRVHFRTIKGTQTQEPFEVARLEPIGTALQRMFGYSREDVLFVLSSMAREGKEPVWSMGDDAPISALSGVPRSLYSFLRQRFAQVTNPPIDSLRERSVMSLKTWLGPRASLSNNTSALMLELSSPILSGCALAALCDQKELPVHHVRALVDLEAQTLETALSAISREAERLVDDGAKLLVISDWGASLTYAPIPMALALGAIHHHLLDSGLRTRVDLVVDTGDCFDIHHVAILVSIGARAVCPWLAARMARDLAGDEGERNLVYALEIGLLKVMAKMGICTVSGYCGGQHFEALGLSADVTERCFQGTPNPLGGIPFAEIEHLLRTRHAAAFFSVHGTLPEHGIVRFRRGGEHHAWSPAVVRALQTAVGSDRASRPNVTSGRGISLLPILRDSGDWNEFDRLTDGGQATSLRNLLDFRATCAIDLSRVEPASEIAKRFITSAMSLGSLSPEAHRTLAIAMNRLGARSNTGEGGEDTETYSAIGDGERCDNKIKQIASGRFGVTTQYIARAEELEIKIAQGSKPGEGGQIPATKVTELIARLRHSQPGVELISPPPHHDIYSIEDLAQLIYDLRRCNPRALIGVKLVAESGVGTIAAGVAKAHADFVVIAGHSGGTGASPLSSIKHAGLPWELGLAEAQQVLVRNHLRERIRLRVDGGLRSGRDVMIAALLGAEEFAFGTGALVAMGCDMARQCHLNTCPTGIATQRPELRAKFRGSAEHVIAYFLHVAEQVRELLSGLGLPSLDEAIGRTDLLQQVRFEGDLNLNPLLARLGATASGPASYKCVCNAAELRTEEPALEDGLVEGAVAAAISGRSFEHASTICNRDRAVGARIAGALARKLPGRTVMPGTLRFAFTGYAGQSFGAFSTTEMRMTLVGEANDYVGKGLCGGEIIIRPDPSFSVGMGHCILGNVALYGATAGTLFAAGAAGERFAVRNSGATAVVEGVGHHGCEYMTGGAVVVLGGVGHNFGAGMTGGTAFVFDTSGDLDQFLNLESVSATDLEPAHGILLKELLERHYDATNSARALQVLLNVGSFAQRFRVVRPLATQDASSTLSSSVASSEVRASR